MVEVFANGASSSLSSDITSTALSLTVASGSAFSTPAAGEQGRIVLDNEIIIFTGRSGNVLSWPSTAYRGAEGTSAVSHTAGATVTQELTAGALATLLNSATMQVISEVIVGPAVAATISLNPIPGTSRNLRLVLAGRTDNAGDSTITARMNGDSGANYDLQKMYAAGASAAGGELLGGTSLEVCTLSPSTAPAGAASQAEIVIYDYARTQWQKMVTSTFGIKTGTGAGANYVQTAAGWWRSTAAITSIVLTPNVGNFAVGTVATLFGEGRA